MKSRKLKYSLRDPMVLLLSCLLAFLTVGCLLASFKKEPMITYSVELDAAFGGDNPGYTGLIEEAGANEKVIDALEALLVQDERFIVYRTHPAGSGMAVRDTIEKIRKDSPELVLSIHCGWNPDSTLSGTRIYPLLKNSSNSNDSMRFAKLILDVFSAEDWNASLNKMYMYEQFDGTYAIEVTGYEEESAAASDESVTVSTWTLLENTEVPCVLVEQYFISCREDVEKWNHEEGYRQIAEKYYTSLCSYFGIEEMEFEEESQE